MTDRIAIVDIETTGLDPYTGHILEVACIVTDWQSLDELHVFDRLVWPGQLHRREAALFADSAVDVVGGLPLDDDVRAMHEASGLLDAFRAARPLRGTADDPRRTVAQTETELVDLLAREAPGAAWGGSGVHFDRAWLAVHMPRVVDVLGYRLSGDVSPPREQLAHWRPDLLGYVVEGGEPAHRALADCRRALRQLLRLRTVFGAVPEPVAV